MVKQNTEYKTAFCILYGILSFAMVADPLYKMKNPVFKDPPRLERCVGETASYID